MAWHCQVVYLHAHQELVHVVCYFDICNMVSKFRDGFFFHIVPAENLQQNVNKND